MSWLSPASSQVYCLLYELKGNAEYTWLQSAGGWWRARGTGRLLNDHLEQSARWTLHQTPRQTPFTGIVIISSIRTCSAHNAAKHTTQDDGRHWLGTLVRHNAAQQICQSVSSQWPVSGQPVSSVRPHRRSYTDIGWMRDLFHNLVNCGTACIFYISV